MAKKKPRKISAHDSTVAYWAAMYNVQAGTLDAYMHEFGDDMGQLAHDAVKAKVQVLGETNVNRREAFLEAFHAIREQRWQVELTRRRTHTAKIAKANVNRAKAGKPNLDG